MSQSKLIEELTDLYEEVLVNVNAPERLSLPQAAFEKWLDDLPDRIKKIIDYAKE